jgi:putative SOS response-associated peptidase YedK
MCSAYYLKRIERKALKAAAALLEKLRREAHETALPLIRPTDPAPIIANTAEGPVLAHARWGLVPHWAKDTTIGRQCFNARGETVHEKPAFRDAFRHSRVLVPASGWYEWTGPKGRKLRHAVEPVEGEVMFAGLRAAWKRPEGDWLETFTIVTVDAIDSLGKLHDRMPLPVPEAEWSLWLEGSPDDARALLVPANDERYTIEPPVEDDAEPPGLPLALD